MWRLIKLLTPYKGLIMLSVLLGFATVGSGMGLIAVSAFIISSAALHPSIAELQVAIVGVRFFGLTRGIFRYLERYVSHQVTFRLLANLRTLFYQALEPLAPARLLGYRSGDLISRVMGDIASLENFYVRCIAPPLVAGLITVAVTYFLGSFHYYLGMALLVFLALDGLLLPFLIYKWSSRVGSQIVEERSRLNSALVDGIQGMGDVLVFGGGRRYFEKIQSLSHELTSTQKQMAGLTAWQSTGNNLLANLAMWSVLVITIPLVNAGKIEGTFLAVLVLASLTSFEAIASLSLAAQYLGNNLQGAHRLFAIVDAKPPVTDPPSTLSLPQDYSLEVKNLNFCYPELQFQSDELFEGFEALHEVTFSLPYRKRMAIVGPSGSGKSTIGNLLLRFWDHRIDDSANNGQILLAGKDIRLYRQEDIRSLIGFVSQHTHLFAGTLRDNLLLAKPEATHEEIAMAVQKARLNDFINSLPEGYNTWIGEQGWNLSAGERQRVAIARALLKNAPILLLDEPTANLDALTERRIITTFLDLMENRSTLLITNHLVGMEAMDEILVLERGEVIERGQHQELLEFQGLYRQMWDLQKQVLAKEF